MVAIVVVVVVVVVAAAGAVVIVGLTPWLRTFVAWLLPVVVAVAVVVVHKP